MNKTVFSHDGKEYGVKDIADALSRTGINPGGSIFVHSDLKSFGRPVSRITRTEFLGAFIEALLRVVGENGDLIMPAFSYNFCKNEVFDPENSPSTVGILTEYFRKLEGVKRSNEAIFSVCALGGQKEYFTDVGTDCFGEKSIFEKLYDKNTRIVFLGETFDMTYLHFIEQRYGVPYRFIKEFKGEIKLGSELKKLTFSYNVRPLDKNVEYDLEGLADFLEKSGALTKIPLGNSKIRAVNAVDAFNAVSNGLKKNIYFLLKEIPA